jgi:hypothetical protein
MASPAIATADPKREFVRFSKHIRKALQVALQLTHSWHAKCRMDTRILGNLFLAADQPSLQVQGQHDEDRAVDSLRLGEDRDRCLSDAW